MLLHKLDEEKNPARYYVLGNEYIGLDHIPNRVRYNAQIEDDLTGLYYLRARYYNTGIGRFTQEDVIYNDGLNLYAYCGSNPVMYEDPSGYTCEPKECAENSKSGSKPSKIQFPENPDDFNPEELRKIGPFGTKNGKIIKWLDENNKAVYEWDEDLTYGSHYHVIGEDGNTRLPNSAGETHFFPGDIFEE